MELTLFDFARAADAALWQPISDGVMGGLSEGRLEATENGTAIFTGNVSLRNYGGFASVRSRPAPCDLRAYDGLLLRVRGDGKGYRLRLRTDPHVDGVAYEQRFATRANDWMVVQVRFRDLYPTLRGQVLQGVPPLNVAAVHSFGLMIADRQEGPFILEVAWLKAWAGEDTP